MAVHVDPARVHEFASGHAFYEWLSRHHAGEPEMWIKIHKLRSGRPSITPAEAIDAALCWGWIDAIRKGFDEDSFLQRYTPRGPKSMWSRVNVDNVARLIAEGRMTEHGLAPVEAAKQDGRWDRAYSMASDGIPADLMAAIEAETTAKATFDRLTAQNRFALAFRLGQIKTEVARARRIAAFVDMLARGETLHPQKR